MLEASLTETQRNWLKNNNFEVSVYETHSEERAIEFLRSGVRGYRTVVVAPNGDNTVAVGYKGSKAVKLATGSMKSVLATVVKLSK